MKKQAEIFQYEEESSWWSILFDKEMAVYKFHPTLKSAVERIKNNKIYSR